MRRREETGVGWGVGGVSTLDSGSGSVIKQAAGLLASPARSSVQDGMEARAERKSELLSGWQLPLLPSLFRK